MTETEGMRASLPTREDLLNELHHVEPAWQRWAWPAAFASVFIVTAVYGVALVYVLGKPEAQWSAWGTWGDSFGFVNAVFTGLSLGAVAISLLMQRTEARRQSLTLLLQAHQLLDQQEETARQIVLIGSQNELLKGQSEQVRQHLLELERQRVYADQPFLVVGPAPGSEPVGDTGVLMLQVDNPSRCLAVGVHVWMAFLSSSDGCIGMTSGFLEAAQSGEDVARVPLNVAPECLRADVRWVLRLSYRNVAGGVFRLWRLFEQPELRSGGGSGFVLRIGETDSGDHALCEAALAVAAYAGGGMLRDGADFPSNA
jgi:hypothetical protein